jgi:hypothetical protein
MAQQFLKDARTIAADVPIVAAAETSGPQTVALPLPFQNGKFSVIACIFVTTSADAATVVVRIRRNPNQENTVVGGPLTVDVGFTKGVNVVIGAVDAVPDGRDCVYVATVTEPAAAANGAIKAGSYIEATAMSG